MRSGLYIACFCCRIFLVLYARNEIEIIENGGCSTVYTDFAKVKDHNGLVNEMKGLYGYP